MSNEISLVTPASAPAKMMSMNLSGSITSFRRGLPLYHQQMASIVSQIVVVSVKTLSDGSVN